MLSFQLLPWAMRRWLKNASRFPRCGSRQRRVSCKDAHDQGRLAADPAEHVSPKGPRLYAVVLEHQHFVRAPHERVLSQQAVDPFLQACDRSPDSNVAEHVVATGQQVFEQRSAVNCDNTSKFQRLQHRAGLETFTSLRFWGVKVCRDERKSEMRRDAARVSDAAGPKVAGRVVASS